MDMNAVTTLITSVGFPIAACVALFWYNYKQATQHKQEIDKLSEAVNNNTKVMSELISKLSK